jgi:hypothetical protein
MDQSIIRRVEELPDGVAAGRTGFRGVARLHGREAERVSWEKHICNAMAHPGSVICLTTAALFHCITNEHGDAWTYLAAERGRIYGGARRKRRSVWFVAEDIGALRRMGAVEERDVGGGAPVPMTTAPFTLAHLLLRSHFAGERGFIPREHVLISLQQYWHRGLSLSLAIDAARALGVPEKATNILQGAKALFNPY